MFNLVVHFLILNLFSFKTSFTLGRFIYILDQLSIIISKKKKKFPIKTYIGCQALFCLKVACILLLFIASELEYCLSAWLDSGWQVCDNYLVKKATSLQSGLLALTFVLSGAQHGCSLREAISAVALAPHFKTKKKVRNEYGRVELRMPCHVALVLVPLKYF